MDRKEEAPGETKDVGEEVYRCKPTDMRKVGIFLGDKTACGKDALGKNTENLFSSIRLIKIF